MLPLLANIWSLGLLAVAAEGYARGASAIYWAAVGLFGAVAAFATWVVWAPHSPLLAGTVLVLLLGPGLLGYGLYLTDRAFACFTPEMTYATLVPSIFWPLLVLVNYAGMLL
jgi:hypothetical protein